MISLTYLHQKNHIVLTLGDFNADIRRRNRFDIVVDKFFINNNFNFVSDSWNNNQFSYTK